MDSDSDLFTLSIGTDGDDVRIVTQYSGPPMVTLSLSSCFSLVKMLCPYVSTAFSLPHRSTKLKLWTLGLVKIRVF